MESPSRPTLGQSTPGTWLGSLADWANIYRDIGKKLRGQGLHVSVADVGTGRFGAGRCGIEWGLAGELDDSEMELWLSDLPDVEIRPSTRGRIVEQRQLMEGVVRPLWTNATYLSCTNPHTERETYEELRRPWTALLTVADYALRGATREEAMMLLDMSQERRERAEWANDGVFYDRHTKHSPESLIASVREAGWEIARTFFVSRGRLFVIAHNPHSAIGQALLDDGVLEAVGMPPSTLRPAG